MVQLSGVLLSVLPISRYPVTREWRRPRVTISVLAAVSIIVYAGLTVWNLATQGHEPVYTSALLPSDPQRADTSCNAVTLNVVRLHVFPYAIPFNVTQGQSMYTYPYGAFTWLITGIDTGVNGFAVSLPYAGASLTANVTSSAFTYYWSMETYNYGVCANVSVPTLVDSGTSVRTSSSSSSGLPAGSVATDANGNEMETVISMCAQFDLEVSNPLAWAAEVQQTIENSFYDMAVYFQNLTLPNNTLPICRFPPYCDPNTSLPPVSDQTITPFNSYQLTAWLAGVRIMPVNLGVNYTSSAGVRFGSEYEVQIVADGTMTDLPSAFQATYLNGTGPSGIDLGVLGIGAVHLATEQDSEDEGFQEPPVITIIRSSALGIVNVIADKAIQDLNGRTFAASYLCTKTTSRWKSPLNLIALVLGNNASLFSTFLVLIVAIARNCENHFVKEPTLPTNRWNLVVTDESVPVMKRGHSEQSISGSSQYQGMYPDALRTLLRDKSEY